MTFYHLHEEIIIPIKREGKLNGLQARLENGVKRGLILSGQLVAQRAKDEVHVVSRRLLRSITNDLPQPIGPMAWRVDIGTNVKYAEEEEFREGKKEGTPHAFLRPALRKNKKKVIEILKENIKAAL